MPLLFDPSFADYMQAYGAGGLKASRLDAAELLARLYWYTVEFGLIDTPLEPDPGQAAPVVVQGNLSLQNVNFRYNTDDPDAPTALSNITLDIAAGETVALVGGLNAGTYDSTTLTTE